MYSHILWGKRGLSSSVIKSSEIKLKNGVTKAKWNNKWFKVKNLRVVLVIIIKNY